MILIVIDLGFLFEKEILTRLEQKTAFTLMFFFYEHKLGFPIYLLDQKFKNSMDLLLLMDQNKSHYAYIKGFDRFMFHKTKNKNKKHFCRVVFYSVLVVKMC